MTKGWLLAGLLLGASSAAAQNTPETTGAAEDGIGLVPAVELRAFARTGDFSHLLELSGFSERTSRLNLSARLGSYYRIHPNVKTGLFWRGQMGARHDADWIKDSDGNWKWKDTSSRLEHVFIADVSPRTILDFISPRLMGELKVRYEFNSFNADQTVKVRPGLFFVTGTTLLTAQFEAYFPVNYGDGLFYETWTYLSALFDVGIGLQLGPFASFRTQDWTSTAEFEETTGNSYGFMETSSVMGLTVILRLGD